jgi:hypothetical protein
MGYGVAPIRFDGGVSNVTATPGYGVELGSLIDYDGKTYRYVYNAGNTQISIGEGCTVSAVSGYSVTVSSTTMADFFVGVVHHATLTTATYGWVVVNGFSKVKAVANTGLTAGDPLTAGGDGRWTPAVSTMTANVQGKCTIATASGGIGEAFVYLGWR